MQLGAVGGREGHVGQDVDLGLLHEGGKLGQRRTELICHLALLAMRHLLGLLGKGGADRGGHHGALRSMGQALRAKWTRQRCQVAFSSLATAALTAR